MEHRYSLRKPVSLDVLLYYQGLPVSICPARDIGLGGISVKPTRLAILPLHSPVEIELLHEDVSKRARLPAYVVHSSSHGVGFLFSTVSQQAFQTIRELLTEPGMTGGATPTMKMAVR